MAETLVIIHLDDRILQISIEEIILLVIHASDTLWEPMAKCSFKNMCSAGATGLFEKGYSCH